MLSRGKLPSSYANKTDKNLSNKYTYRSEGRWGNEKGEEHRRNTVKLIKYLECLYFIKFERDKGDKKSVLIDANQIEIDKKIFNKFVFYKAGREETNL